MEALVGALIVGLSGLIIAVLTHLRVSNARRSLFTTGEAATYIGGLAMAALAFGWVALVTWLP